MTVLVKKLHVYKTQNRLQYFGEATILYTGTVKLIWKVEMNFDHQFYFDEMVYEIIYGYIQV